MLGRLVRRMAGLAPPRHRELARAMAAELDAIADPAERARFALGAVAAIVRLALTRAGSSPAGAPDRFAATAPAGASHPGGSSMPELTTRRLLGRLAAAFAVSLASLTAILLANYAARQVPGLRANGAPAGSILQALVLAAPFTLALTIPMAVFLAVTWVFTRLGAEGVLAAAARERHGLHRLVVPVLGAAAVVSALTLVSNAEVVPRANARLEAIFGKARSASDRAMTVGQLRDAVRRASGADAAPRIAAYEVEIQKKFALAAACLVLALAGAAAAIRRPRGGFWLVLGAAALVFPGYYQLMIAGESLAERQVVSPVVGMWTANALLLVIGLVLVRAPGPEGPRRREEVLAIDG